MGSPRQPGSAFDRGRCEAVLSRWCESHCPIPGARAALHRGESGPTYERLIAVALRCGEGGEGEPLGESDKRTEGDSERR